MQIGDLRGHDNFGRVRAPPAEKYPERPIRLLIPFAPGGATDIVARMMGPKLSERLGQQIVADNRAGAAGNIAVELVAAAQPDGYTLLMGNISTNSINPILFAGTHEGERASRTWRA